MDFQHALIDATRERKSWRERLQWIRDRLTDPDFAPAPEPLATVAIYLRLLATGELPCQEDGQHFRPNHHAQAAEQIESALERLTRPETAWIIRRIYPYLPSWGEEFRRSEPLTRIRDIAHRNDIPHELKQEIKQRLQNKLHRCAGPEDLLTAREILQRITAPEAGFTPAFVQEFHTFHGELAEFFNATALESRLRTLGPACDPAIAESVKTFLDLKGKEPLALEELLTLLDRLTGLRQQLAEQREGKESHLASQMRLADIGLEDFAFTLLSEAVNRLAGLGWPAAWPALLRTLMAALNNLSLSLIEPEECSALHSECLAWANGFCAEDRFHLLRTLATLSRARRLAEGYTDRINRLFPPLVEQLGQALGIADHAIKVFAEGDIRGHIVFQLSRLVDLGLQSARNALGLPPWEAIVPGESVGKLVHARDLMEVEGETGPLMLLLDRADGDAEIPAAVKGIALGHPMPHLSHLGVRARQARIPFAAAPTGEQLKDFESLLGTTVRLRVTPDGLTMHPAEATEANPGRATPADAFADISVPQAVLTNEPVVLALAQARPETCGAKAAAAARLLELAEASGGLFRAPRGLAIPFGVMEWCLGQAPEIQREYRTLQEQLQGTAPGNLESLLQSLRELLLRLPMPEQIGKEVTAFFSPEVRLAVRSSANGEDLEKLSGAGLYESIVNVLPAGASVAVAQVWASLWTRRATLSRTQAGIPHAQIHMAVLLQELVSPDLSFIMHTVNPLTGAREEALVELAVGLGETLASSSVPGTPYRLACHRKTSAVSLLSCSSFSIALRPAPAAASGIVQERLDYSRIALSTDAAFSARLGKRLAQIAVFLEERLGLPQDVEGVWMGDTVHLVQTRPQQGL